MATVPVTGNPVIDDLLKFEAHLERTVEELLLFAPDHWRAVLPAEVTNPLTELENKLKNYITEHASTFLVNVFGSLSWLISKLAEPVGFKTGLLVNGYELGKQEANVIRPNALLDIETLSMLLNRDQINPSRAREEAIRQGWTSDRLEALRLARQQPMGSPDLMELWRRGVISRDGFLTLMKWQGMPNQQAELLSNLVNQLLAPTTLLTYWLRHDKGGIDVDNKLKQHGFDDEQVKILKELSEFIPPIPDLIRFAVREAFSPEQIQELDLDQEFPQEFAKWAKRQGVAEDWSHKYWQSHWELPSTFQALEMYQRELITREQLEALLKAQDIAPKWREKFLGIAYNIPTRVDTRRMYEMGIINAEQVEKNYLHSGYSPDDAKALREFVEADVFESTVSPVRARILTLFRKGIVDEQELTSFLKDLQMPDDRIVRFVAAEKMLAEEERTERLLNALKKQFFANRIDTVTVSARLVALGLSVLATGRILQEWVEEKASRITRLSARDIHEALKQGIIDAKEGRKLLEERNMSSREIDIFIALDHVQPEEPPV